MNDTQLKLSPITARAEFIADLNWDFVLLVEIRLDL